MPESNIQKTFKLSPSDFKYLWEDCKYCYWQKVVNGVQLPSIGMPGIFSKMNGQVQEMALGMNIQEFVPELPPGIITAKEGYLRSKSLPNRNLCFLTGRFDVLTKFEDSSYGVIDLKITDPKTDNLYKFSTQLHAYKFALENPENGVPVAVSRMGLVVMSPEQVAIHKGHIFFRSKPIWYEIEEDMDTFIEFVDQVSDLLSSGPPLPSPVCRWCIYRTRFQNFQTTPEQVLDLTA